VAHTKYRKNYLDNVILQFRFPACDGLGSALPKDFHERIKDHFPMINMGKHITVEATAKPDATVEISRQTEKISWVFSAIDGASSLGVAADEFTLVYKKWDDFPPVRSVLRTAWASFRDIYDVKMISRVGFRYVDVIAIPVGNPLDWDGYIAEALVKATLPLDPPAGHTLRRSMHAMCWATDDYRVTFQFGMHNPEFPNAITKRQFIVDSDCYSLGPVPADEGESTLGKFNRILIDLFERSIGPKLRHEMGEETVEDGSD